MDYVFTYRKTDGNGKTHSVYSVGIVKSYYQYCYLYAMIVCLNVKSLRTQFSGHETVIRHGTAQAKPVPAGSCHSAEVS